MNNNVDWGEGRPITEAPIDGTEVLAWVPEHINYIGQRMSGHFTITHFSNFLSSSDGLPRYVGMPFTDQFVEDSSILWWPLPTKGGVDERV